MELESQGLGVENDGPQVENCELEVSAEENLSTSEEEMVVKSIDSTTGYHDLSAKLLDLHPVFPMGQANGRPAYRP